MRCQQADRRLKEYQWDHALINADRDLRDHLESCNTCAQALRAADELRGAFSALRSEQQDNSGENSTTPFAFLRTRIEARLGSQKDQPLMSRLIKQLQANTRAGKLGLTAAVAVVALAVFTLIPFSYEKTVGYEVAFAGVDKNLALNTDELQNILVKLGMPQAEFNVSDCEATCKVKFSELPTSDDARLLVAAFSEFETIKLDGEIERIAVKIKGSLVEKAGDNLRFGTFTHAEKSDSELHNVVLECLGEDFSETCNLLIEKVHGVEVSEGGQFVFDTREGTLSGTGNLRLLSEDGSDAGAVMIQQLVGCAPSDCMTGDGTAVQCIIAGDCDSSKTCDLTDCLKICSTDFNVRGELTDEEIQRLRDEGFEVTITETTEGIKQIMLRKNSGDAAKFGDEDPFAEDIPLEKELSATLPEGYELSQNYPNPFNPTTKIDFTVPNAEHVTVEIINLMGQKVRTLVDETVGAGVHSVEWDATNDYGEKVSSGMYFYRLKVGAAAQSKKMTLLK